MNLMAKLLSSLRKYVACLFFPVLAGFATANTAVAQSSNNQTSKQALQQLSGKYKSVSPEDWGRGTFGTREFSFDKGKWSLRFVLALDPEMKMPVFEFRTLGTYKVQNASEKVPGAFEALFLEEKKFVMLKTGDEKLVQGFGLAGCGLTKDIEKDVSVSGCALWKPVAVCGEDHDLLSLDKSGNLFFGARPADNDMCTADKRPTKLTPPVRKAK
jgi:hypothetical protein